MQGARAQLRSVRLGLHTLGAVEVLDGLAEGDQVLQGGALQAGQRVRARAVVWAPAASAKPGNGARAVSATTIAVPTLEKSTPGFIATRNASSIWARSASDSVTDVQVMLGRAAIWA